MGLHRTCAQALSNVTVLRTAACHSSGIKELPDSWLKAVVPIFNRDEAEDMGNCLFI